MKVVIIGNGVAGTNAARHIRKLSDHQIVMVSDESLQPFSRTALMYIYMGHVKEEQTHLYEDWFWEKNRIQRVFGRVAAIDLNQKAISLQNGELISFDRLIIASGSKSNKFGWPGQDLDGVHGLYHLQDLAAMQRHTPHIKRAVIVGGGLIGIEMAEMFHSRQIQVTFLVREASFWDLVLPPEESNMVNRHIREHGIDLRLNTELAEIKDDGKGGVAQVLTKSGELIDCQFVGLTVGVSPNIDFIRTSGLELNRGVLVNAYLQTSHPDVYAIGDCAELRAPLPGRRPIEAIWYTGRMMGQTVAATICGTSHTYVPKLWFNSAKFLDIEYQIYGDVPAKLPEGIDQLYWEHSSGKKAIRIHFDATTKAVKGFHLMGMRYRHEVCEKWILEKTHIESVLEHLALANFDPEFFASYEPTFIALYNQRTGKTLQPKAKRNLNSVTQFLRNKLNAAIK
jgi:NADPH-dependent 2,4-dienoyl-CoA reductase/sulfur reductase-like enzyme